MNDVIYTFYILIRIKSAIVQNPRYSIGAFEMAKCKAIRVKVKQKSRHC